MKRKGSFLTVMLLILVMLASLVQPCSAYAAAKSCTKGVVYQNGLAGIKISINKAPYNTIFTDTKIQGSIVSVAYDYDGCGWFAFRQSQRADGQNQRQIYLGRRELVDKGHVPWI